jgi:plasmid maintenance system antidote protein VapI
MSVTHLVTGSTDLTPEMTLADAKNFELDDVMVVGYDMDGDLIVRSSHMTRANAVYMLLAAIDHARGLTE